MKSKSNYYIEIRYFGRSKSQIKNIVNNVTEKFSLKRRKTPPHITLVQPFTTKNQSKLISDFKQICSKYRMTKFTVDGVGVFPFHVVFLKVIPGPKLVELRNELLNKIKTYSSVRSVNRPYHPHTTIALNMGLIKFFRIWLYLKRKKRIIFTNHVIRITLLKDGKILHEYDYTNKQLLNRKQAKSKRTLSTTFRRLKSQKGKK